MVKKIPNYDNPLRNMTPHIRQALRNGSWDVTNGADMAKKKKKKKKGMAY